MIDIYVNEIRRALHHQCYFPALALALALPDICGMAEFPGLNVTDRYIAWYDKYLGSSTAQSGRFDDTPYLSGEVVYNLRCTFLHQGSPNVQTEKIREAANQVDRFTLVLGDGKMFHEIQFSANMGTPETGVVYIRFHTVEVTYLCEILCDAAHRYYQQNKNKFHFDFSVISQDALFGGTGGHSDAEILDLDAKILDSVGKLLLKKMEPSGMYKMRLDAQDEKKPEGGKPKEGKPEKEKPKEGKTKKEKPKEGKPKKPKKKDGPENKKPQGTAQAGKKAVSGKKSSPSKTEHQLRCLFGQHFKEKKYREKREDIIQAVLTAPSKQQLNNILTKLFPGEDVKVILQRFKEQIKDLPGQ